MEVWQFVVEWYDPVPQMKRKFILKYYVEHHQVEMINVNSNKLFLKRSPPPPEVTASDFYLGNKIILFSRDLEIVDYADKFTKQKLQHQCQRSLIFFTPDAYHNWGKMLDLVNIRLSLVKVRIINFSEHQAENVCRILSLNNKRAQALSRGLCLVAYVQGEDGIEILCEVAESLRDSFSAGESSPAVVCPQNGTEINEITELIATSPPTVTLNSCTCCLIKPHAVKEKSVGNILDLIISQGYEISAMETLFFDKTQAEEFLEVYKGVIPEFKEQVDHMTTGISIALEVRAEDAVTVFRQTAGPWDVSVAKELRPGTIRALYGTDKVRSAVHCTDLPTDGVSECEYLFSVMPPVK